MQQGSVSQFNFSSEPMNIFFRRPLRLLLAGRGNRIETGLIASAGQLVC